MNQSKQQFDSYGRWVNDATLCLTQHRSYGQFFRTTCIDTKGRICRNGADFMRARDEDAFPIRWWWPDQPIEELVTPYTDPVYVSAAEEMWCDDDINIDDDATVSDSDDSDDGAWVQAWVWVPISAVEGKQT